MLDGLDYVGGGVKFLCGLWLLAAIPGHLLAAGERSPVTLDRDGHPGTRVTDEPARLVGLILPAGARRLELDASGPAVVSLRTPSTTVAEGPAPLRFEAPGEPPPWRSGVRAGPFMCAPSGSMRRPAADDRPDLASRGKRGKNTG
jgi:hypothetical protein